MKQGKKNIAGTVRELVAPIVSALGYLLWDVEYVKEGSEWYLRITIDSPETAAALYGLHGRRGACKPLRAVRRRDIWQTAPRKAMRI